MSACGSRCRSTICVVHLVDVVAGEDHDVFRPLFLDGVDVLVDGVGGALIPVLVDALLRRHDVDELAQLAATTIPAEVDVPVEAHRLVLGGTRILRSPLLRQFESVKSMIR